MSGYQRFQEDWERDAKRERASFDAMPVADLLERIRTARYGDFYTIWYALARKADLAEAGWPLLDVLNSQADYLIRYHCAAALIQIAPDSLREWEPVMLSAERYPVREYLDAVQRVIEAAVGPRVT